MAISLDTFLKTLAPFYGRMWVETLDVNEDGVEVTLHCVRYRKSDKEPKCKTAFIHSEKRNRINSDLDFTRLGGWVMLFEPKNYYGYTVSCEDILIETELNYPGITKVERLWDINDLHRLAPETKYFDSVPESKVVEFIKMWRKHPELEFVWKDKDLKWHWADSRIYKLKNKQTVIKLLKKNGGNLNDALGLLKYGSEEKREKERAINRTIRKWNKELDPYHIGKQYVLKLDDYLKGQNCEVYDYRDYLELCVYFKKSLKDYGVLFPKNLMESHDRLVKLKQLKEDKKERAKLVRMEAKIKTIASHYEDMLKHLSTDVYKLAVPNSVDQFVDIGNKMKNCVGTNGYQEKMYKGDCLIVVAFKKNKPVVCVELTKKFEIRQLRGLKNQNTKPCNEVKPLINAFINQAVQCQRA